ncbi:MAG TPA: carbon-nitrogen hydrolase family protein [Ktedonobacteraceae bacterium]|nr:carbon-nitrogen hydrolase family protein [Ktedonobacteraceae bacterium]
MFLRTAVVQFAIDQYNPQRNLARSEQYIAEASKSHDLIVFPEDFLLGPLNAKSEYADFEGQYIRIFKRFASKYHIDIVPGSIIEGDSTGLFNTTYYIDRSGEILGNYRKMNLWLPERSYITPGSNISVFDTRFGRVGLIICWDLMFPEVFRAMVKEKVEIVICPSYWCYEDAGQGILHDPDSEIKLVNALCITRAFENEIVLVYANAAGTYISEDHTETLIGQSQVTVPFKGMLQSLSHNREEMLSQEIDTTILDDAEEAYEIRKDLQKGISS